MPADMQITTNSHGIVVILVEAVEVVLSVFVVVVATVAVGCRVTIMD